MPRTLGEVFNLQEPGEYSDATGPQGVRHGALPRSKQFISAVSPD